MRAQTIVVRPSLVVLAALVGVLAMPARPAAAQSAEQEIRQLRDVISQQQRSLRARYSTQGTEIVRLQRTITAYRGWVQALEEEPLVGPMPAAGAGLVPPSPGAAPRAPNPASSFGTGTPPVRRFQAWVLSNWPQFGFGITSVRPIAGTNTWSQHSYSNAADCFSTFDNMQSMALAAYALWEELHIAHVIFNRRVSSYGSPWRPYTGVSPHTDHVHVDFIPQWEGTPPGRPESG